MKRVQADELRVGMFVQRIEGSWLSHGIWRRRFLITDAAVLAATRACGAEAFVVDSEPDVEEQIPTHAQAPPPPCEGALSASAPLRSETVKTCSMDEELARAAQIRTRAFDNVVTMFSDVASGRPPDVDAARSVVEDVVASVDRNAAALASLVRLKSQHDYTYMHSVAVCVLMVALARQLKLDDELCGRLGLAGLFHDIGKAVIPTAILDKPGRLSDDEFALVRTHAVRGHEILVESGLQDDLVLNVCLHHHEKIDGTGYPGQLAGEQIVQAARMGAICDVYDAVTSNRSYKEAWDPAVALTKMASWNGHFDRTLFAAFIKLTGVYPVGSLVRLSSARLAVVIENHPDALQKPVVKVFSSIKSGMRVPTERVDLNNCRTGDCVESRESREGWSPQLLDELCGLRGAITMKANR